MLFRSQSLQPALSLPRSVLGAGLGCWIDSRTNNTWSITPQSAIERVCMLMNQSVTEIDMFDLHQDLTQARNRQFPEPFWIPVLEKFMAGGGCDATFPRKPSCPNATTGPANAWQAGDDAGCCVSSSNRGQGAHCNITCAQAECAAAAGWKWRPENYSSHPYECCH